MKFILTITVVLLWGYFLPLSQSQGIPNLEPQIVKILSWNTLESGEGGAWAEGWGCPLEIQRRCGSSNWRTAPKQ